MIEFNARESYKVFCALLIDSRENLGLRTLQIRSYSFYSGTIYLLHLLFDLNTMFRNQFCIGPSLQNVKARAVFLNEFRNYSQGFPPVLFLYFHLHTALIAHFPDTIPEDVRAQ